MSKHLLVGFGGSGIKALSRFAAWVSQDYAIALRARDDFAFLLCDTDMKDLEDGKKRILACLEKVVRDPLVYTVELSGSVGNNPFYSIAEDTFSRAAALDPKSRLREAWWYRTDTGTPRPFSAPTLEVSVRHGAGQCPHVSAFLAWKAADDDVIRRQVNEIIQQFQHRSQGGSAQDLMISTYLVAGLAGGTGRGSWMPIGLEIAQHIQERGLQGNPQGFFFDATVRESSPQFIKQQVNALTGVSEVVGWLRNANDKNNPMHIELPSLQAPSDIGADAISTRHCFNAPGGTASPIKQAFLFGGQSRAGRVRQEGVYSLVGSAIFSRIAQTRIAADQINEGFQRLGSMGAAQYWVPATELRQYLASRVKAEIPALLVSSDPAMLTQAASGIVSDLQKWLKPVDGNPLVKAVQDRLAEDAKPTLDAFAAKLGTQKKDQAILFATQELPKAISSERLDAAIDRAFSKAFEVPNVGQVTEAIRIKILQASRALSLRDVHQLIGLVQKELTHGAKLAEKMGAIASPSIVAGIQEYSKSVAFFGLGEVFDRQEIEGLRKQAEMYIRAEGAKRGGERLLARLKAVHDQLALWSSTLKQFVQMLGDTSTADAPVFEAQKDDLFLSDPNSIGVLAAADQLLDPRRDSLGERLISRPLRPVLGATDLEELMRQTCQAGADQKKVLAEITSLAMETSLGTAEHKPGEFTANVSEQLKQFIARLRGSVQVDQFRLERSFGFIGVVRRLIKHWISIINSSAIQADRVKQDELARAFRRAFGHALVRDRAPGGTSDLSTFTEPELKEVLVSMAIDLAATCDPMIEFTSNRLDRVSLFLPRDEMETKLLEGVGEMINAEREKRQQDERVRIDEITPNRTDCSPFLMMAVTHAWIDLGLEVNAESRNRVAVDEILCTSLDGVNTFRYRHEGTVRRWLEAAERADGRSLFEPELFGQGTYGFGFVSPKFVRDAGWRRLRWRPWAVDVEAEELKKQEIHADAAVWALSMTSGAHASMLEPSVADAIQRHFHQLHDAQSPLYKAVGDFLQAAAAANPGLGAKPFLIGPCRDGARYRVSRRLLTTDPVDKKIKEGTGADSVPFDATSFDSLRKFLEFLKDPKNAGHSEKILHERDLVHGFLNDGNCFNPRLVEQQLALAVSTLLAEETIRLRRAPEQSLHMAALGELSRAADRWGALCQGPTD